MPIPVMSYPNPLLSQPIHPSPFLTGMQSGVSMNAQLQQLMENARRAPLQREHLAAQTKLYEAQAVKAMQLAKSPHAGQMLPGAAGRAQGLSILKGIVGENSETYQNALKDYNTDIKLKIGRTNYFNANTVLKNVPEINKLQIMENWQNEQEARTQQGLQHQSFQEWYSKPTGSLQQAETKSGLAPTRSVGTQSMIIGSPATTTTPTAQEHMLQGTQHVGQQVPPTLQPAGMAQQPQAAMQQPQMPQQQMPQQMPQQVPHGLQPQGLTQEPFGFEAKQTGLGLIQKTVPQFTQQKLAYSTNIEKTIALMPESAISTYSQSPVKLAEDYADSLDGKISPAYGKYLQFITNAKLLSTQARQFWGDTITPSGIKRLDELSNPISWRTNPKAALIKYRALKNTLEREIETYKKFATDPSAIQPRPGGAPSPHPDDPLGIR